jgi:two-component system, NarL family, sensor histidine kinase UhpB
MQLAGLSAERRLGNRLSESRHAPETESSSAIENTLAALISEYETSHERIGRALHDDIGQVLSGVGLQLAVLRLDFKDVPGLAERTAELQSMLERAMVQVRELSSGLNPSTVERSGLQFALETIVAEAKQVFPGPVRLHYDLQVHVPREVASSFYRIVKYSINYAIRSGTATQIDVSVKHQSRTVGLEVRLDGAPHPPVAENSDARMELLTLQYHARKTGIAFAIESTSGRGTIITSIYSRQGG